MPHPTRTSPRRAFAATGAALLLVGGLAACGSDSGGSSGTATTTTTAATTTSAGPITLTDGWVRSKEATPGATGMAADMSMTGVFGMLANTTGQEITITGGSTSAAPKVEMHETVRNAAGEMVMQERQGGFVLPANSTFELKPGGNHIMLMDMTAMPKIGTDVELTLNTSAGDVVLTIPVRNFAGGDEKYMPAGGGTSAPAGSGKPSMSGAAHS